MGEVYLLDLERVVAYVNSGRELHLAHNFTFVRLPWDAAAFRANIDGWEAAASDVAWPAWFLANHDHPRVASRFDDGGLGPARARAVLLLLYALRGTPFVFQGEELGLPDATIPPERVVDVDGRDPERAPVPWERPSVAGPGAGFTTGEPWLPLHEDAERYAVAAQRDDPASTFSLARRLAWLRARRRRPAGRRPAHARRGRRPAGLGARGRRRPLAGRAELRDGAAPPGAGRRGPARPWRPRRLDGPRAPRGGRRGGLDGLELAAGEAVLVRLA